MVSQLFDLIYTHFTVSYRDALNRLRVRLNIILLLRRTRKLRFLDLYIQGRLRHKPWG